MVIQEIIVHILSFIPLRPDTQSTYHALTLVSRAWYAAAIIPLYTYPFLSGANFQEFATTICPSKNAHITPSNLAPLVRTLDMSALVHNSSRSLTARLLGRLKHNLEAFIAPQASFALNSFAALGKCSKLTYLDLSFISASISNEQLFRTMKGLDSLTTLSFPRSSNLDKDEDSPMPYTWPHRLEVLNLAGGVNTHFLLTHLVAVPKSLEKLSINHCSSIYPGPLVSVLRILGSQLKHLTVRHPMTKLHLGALDEVLHICPSLTILRISADYITTGAFTSLSANTSHPLQILDLECSPQATADVQIPPAVIYEAVESGRLASLRSVRVSARLAWTATAGRRQDIEDLVEAMADLDAEEPWIGGEVGCWASLMDV